MTVETVPMLFLSASTLVLPPVEGSRAADRGQTPGCAAGEVLEAEQAGAEGDGFPARSRKQALIVIFRSSRPR